MLTIYSINSLVCKYWLMTVFMWHRRNQELDRCVSLIVVSSIIDFDVLVEGFG